MGGFANAEETIAEISVPQTLRQTENLIPLQPLNDVVIIARVEPVKMSRGGIHLPDVAQEVPVEGVVMAVGPGVLLEDGSRSPMDVKPGDHVVFKKYSGAEEVKIGDSRLIAVKQEMLLAKIIA